MTYQRKAFEEIPPDMLRLLMNILRVRPQTLDVLPIFLKHLRETNSPYVPHVVAYIMEGDR